jgi:hypothetical protein
MNNNNNNKILLLVISFILSTHYTNAAIDNEVEQQPRKKSAPWDYEPNIAGFLSPNEWYKGYPECAGKLQSPIDVDVSKTRFDDGLKRIVVDYEKSVEDEIYDSDMYSVVWSMHNNGKTGMKNWFIFSYCCCCF